MRGQQKQIPPINKLVAHNMSVFKVKINSTIEEMNGSFTSGTRPYNSEKLNRLFWEI